jgi:hypothetical protein
MIKTQAKKHNPPIKPKKRNPRISTIKMQDALRNTQVVTTKTQAIKRNPPIKPQNTTHQSNKNTQHDNLNDPKLKTLYATNHLNDQNPSQKIQHTNHTEQS